MKCKNIEGQRFGSLLALRYVYTKNRMAFWEYKCVCGKLHIARANTITYEAKRHPNSEFPSCGCKELAHKTKHNYRNVNKTHPLYRCWNSIKNRCYNPNVKGYKFYGALGITMCNEWLNNPKAFIEWGLVNGYKKGLVIDKDYLCDKLGFSPKIYSPQTCRFITPQESSIYSSNRINHIHRKSIKLTPQQVKEIIYKYEQGQTRYSLSKEYSISSSAMYKLVKKFYNNIKSNELNEH